MYILERFLCEDAVAASMAVVGGGIMVTKWLAHSLYMESYASNFMKYGLNHKPLPLLDNDLNRFKNVVADLEFSDWNKKYMKCFTGNTLDVKSLGSTKTRFGIMIGIPEYFRYDTKEELEKSQFYLDGKLVRWTTEDGEKLLDALTLSDYAKMYALAKEIAMTDNYWLYIKSCMPFCFLIAAYRVGSTMKTLFNLNKKPLRVAMFPYGLVAAFFYGLYVVCYDGIVLTYEKSAEERIFALSRSYAIGALEYYTKQLERNKTLRRMLKKGDKLYTVGGNEVTTFRSRTAPVTFKKMHAEHYLKERYEWEAFAKIPTPVQPKTECQEENA